MNLASVSLAAKELAWVRPANSALLALTTEELPSATDWDLLVRDPALLAHLLRFARPSLTPDHSSLKSELLLQPALPLQAARFLSEGPKTVRPVDLPRTFALAASIAKQLASAEEQTWAVALTQLPALGWLAYSQLGHDPRHLPSAQTTHHLLTRWRVPDWVVAVVSGLPLLATDAERLGAPAQLFRIVQTAIATAESLAGSLGLTNSTATVANDINLEIDSAPPPSDQQISDELLIRLLRQTSSARRVSAALWLHQAEEREQNLLQTLALAREEFADQVLQARLDGLAEFAAGASHEINNPLAVISGHAQLLLPGEADPTRQKQLQTIIRQTRRIDEILHGTRQFARPTNPKPARFRPSDWVTELTQLFQVELEAKQLRWEIQIPEDLFGYGDPTQLRQALIHLIRNAIEAVPTKGLVQVLTQADSAESFVIDVLDSGSGPTLEQQPHLFDPFFSGRSAGRGRGLGLSIAWRLAVINGGTVRYLPADNGPTHFQIEIPQFRAYNQLLSAYDRMTA